MLFPHKQHCHQKYEAHSQSCTKLSTHFRQNNRPRCRIRLHHSLPTKENKVKNVILPQYIYIHRERERDKHTRAHTHTHIHIHTDKHTHTHTYKHTHIQHTYTHIYIYKQTHAHTLTHTHTHTHRVRGREREEELVSWCFEPSQLQRITSGLSHSFHKSSFHKSCFVVVFLAYLYSAGTQHGNLHPAG